MNTERQIIFYEHYFVDFYLEQSEKVQEKIEYVFKILRTVQNVPKKFLDHMTGTDGLYEIRIEFESNIYRIFCCFDKGNLVVLFNGFQKKSQKTPKKEIDVALRLKEAYFNLKKEIIMNKENIRNAKNFDELLDIKYGNVGTEKRDDFEEKAQYFIISEILKEARKEANMTQEQLADKVGTKKSYISRLENGKCDIQLSTLYRIFEYGLGKRVRLVFG